MWVSCLPPYLHTSSIALSRLASCPRCCRSWPRALPRHMTSFADILRAVCSPSCLCVLFPTDGPRARGAAGAGQGCRRALRPHVLCPVHPAGAAVSYYCLACRLHSWMPCRLHSRLSSVLAGLGYQSTAMPAAGGRLRTALHWPLPLVPAVAYATSQLSPPRVFPLAALLAAPTPATSGGMRHARCGVSLSTAPVMWRARWAGKGGAAVAVCSPSTACGGSQPALAVWQAGGSLPASCPFQPSPCVALAVTACHLPDPHCMVIPVPVQALGYIPASQPELQDMFCR